jgi:hypothetical protein
VADWWRKQATSDVWIESQCDLILKHEPMVWFGEKGVIQKAVEPYLMRRMQQRKPSAALSGWPALRTSRRGRGRCRHGEHGKGVPPQARTVEGRPVSQLLRFPAGKHDDAVDVLGLFGRGMEFMATTSANPLRREQGQSRWTI